MQYFHEILHLPFLGGQGCSSIPSPFSTALYSVTSDEDSISLTFSAIFVNGHTNTFTAKSELH